MELENDQLRYEGQLFWMDIISQKWPTVESIKALMDGVTTSDMKFRYTSRNLVCQSQQNNKINSPNSKNVDVDGQRS